MLNPETSSDSPSAKSNGVRFVSARQEVNQSSNIKDMDMARNGAGAFRPEVKDRVENRVRGHNIIRVILTSYEMVCATARSAPNSAYFEFEAHPAPRTIYTLSLEIARKIKTLYETNRTGELEGYSVHIISAKIRAKAGAPIKIAWLLVCGQLNSFVKSFMASAMGCGSPISPTLFGPLRVCE